MTPIDELIVAGSLTAWLLSNLMAATRRTSSGLGWYIASGLTEGGVAIAVGLLTGLTAWIAIGSLWCLVKVVIIPGLIRRDLGSWVYGVKAQGTPRLMLGSAVLLAVLWWTLGPLGVSLAAVVTPFWLIAERHEVWIQALLLLEAEIGVGFLTLVAESTPGGAELAAAGEVVALAVLLVWLLRASHEHFGRVPESEQLTRLRG